MCGSMADIQSAAAEIRQGKKEEQTTAWKYICSALLHRATINEAVDLAQNRSADANVWHYSLLAVHARKEKEESSNSSITSISPSGCIPDGPSYSPFLSLPPRRSSRESDVLYGRSEDCAFSSERRYSRSWLPREALPSESRDLTFHKLFGYQLLYCSLLEKVEGQNHGWSKKRRDDGTPGGRYATGDCPIVVYVRLTHDGTLAHGVVQATGQTMRHV